jgi:hypothetical protein
MFMRRVLLIPALILTFALPSPAAEAICTAPKRDALALFVQQAEILRRQGMTEDDITGRLLFSGKTAKETRLAIKMVQIVFRYDSDPGQKLAMIRQECDHTEADD